MNIIREIYLQTDWLYTKIFQNDVMFLDLWSFVHLWSGFGIIILAKVLQIKRPVRLMVLILVAYEMLEILFLLFTFSIFRPETIKDQFTDIFIGIAGGLSSVFILKIVAHNKNKREKPIMIGIALYAAVTIAFFWVGFYRYRYNYEFMNSPGINFWAFTWWTIACFVVINTYLAFGKHGAFIAITGAYAIYAVSLLIIEYCSYHWAGMHEISKPGSKALIFELIRGTPALHLFYITSPGISIAAFHLAKWLIYKASKP
jgi:hypothetical protein